MSVSSLAAGQKPIGKTTCEPGCGEDLPDRRVGHGECARRSVAGQHRYCHDREPAADDVEDGCPDARHFSNNHDRQGRKERQAGGQQQAVVKQREEGR